MKQLILILLFVLLTGCVKYYQPETAYEDGVYYAEDDPAYILNSSDYSGVVYYPWSSLDYFYVGYWPYYGYPYSYMYWPPYAGYCMPYVHCHHFYRGGGHDRYARKGHKRRDRGGNDDAGVRDQENEFAKLSKSSINRRVSTAPTGYGGDQGMVIWSRESNRPGQSKVGPVQTTSKKPVTVKPITSNTSGYSSAQSTRGSYSRSAGSSRPTSSRSSSSRSSSRSSMGRKSSSRRNRD